MADVKLTDYRCDNESIWTHAFNSAIKDLAAAGGGRLLVPAGNYVSGTISLLSNVVLHLEAGSRIIGSSDLADYTTGDWGHNIDRTPWHLITSRGTTGCGLTGEGTIDGRGPLFWERDPYDPTYEGGFIRAFKDRRPSPMVEFVECSALRVEGVTLQDSPGWTLHLHDCTDVAVQGISIRNSPWGPNTDGIDMTGSQRVFVEDCDIQTGDDGVCLKTTGDSRATRDIVVRRCRISSMCAGLKLGCVESVQDMSNVLFEDCEVRGCSRMLAIYSYRGARIERVTARKITGDTRAPLIQNRPIHIEARIDRPDDSQPDAFVHEPETRAAWIKHVTIEDFSAETDGRIMIVGSDGLTVSDINITELTLRYPVVYNAARTADEAASRQFANNSPEARRAMAAVVADGVQNLELTGLNIVWPKGTEPTFHWLPNRRFENGSFRAFAAISDDLTDTMGSLWVRRSSAFRAAIPGDHSPFGTAPLWDTDSVSDVKRT